MSYLSGGVGLVHSSFVLGTMREGDFLCCCFCDGVGFLVPPSSVADVLFMLLLGFFPWVTFDVLILFVHSLSFSCICNFLSKKKNPYVRILSAPWSLVLNQVLRLRFDFSITELLIRIFYL